MILKFAIFTMVASLIPMILIGREFLGEINNFLSGILPKTSLNIDLINDILITGVFKYLFESNNDMSNIIYDKSNDKFSKEMLQKFNGQNGRTLYLAILGNVFDVTKAAKYYGPGEAYNVFAGRDGSRAFVTGDFTESGLTDLVDDLSLQELRSLNDWLKFYHKEYTFKGKLIGLFYDEHGNPTAYNHRVQLKIEQAENDEKDKRVNKMKFPPCNVEWTPEYGSRVWCTKRSGGIERDWIGVPRKLYEPGANNFRCACINEAELSPVIAPETGKVRSRNIEEYEACHPKSDSCYITNL